MSECKIKKLYDPILMQDYYLLIGVSDKDYRSTIMNELGVDVGDPEQYNHGHTQMHEMGDGYQVPYIWTKSTNIDDIVHECFHAVADVFDWRGISLSPASEEVYAYTLAWLVRAAVGNNKKKGNK